MDNSTRQHFSCLITPAVHYPVISPGHACAADSGLRRIVLSVPDDERDCVNRQVSGIFHAAWSKNCFLIDALEAAAPDPAIIGDADVWLSRDLLKRIHAVPGKCPAKGMLYGLAGRRVCRNLPSRDDGPRMRLERHKSILGYCQFTLWNEPDPWRTVPCWGGNHDDWRVYKM